VPKDFARRTIGRSDAMPESLIRIIKRFLSIPELRKEAFEFITIIVSTDFSRLSLE
jgi:hypothetical protein